MVRIGDFDRTESIFQRVDAVCAADVYLSVDPYSSRSTASTRPGYHRGRTKPPTPDRPVRKSS